MENWKPVYGYEDIYHVSDHGRVKRLVGKRSRNERLLKPGVMTVGYLFVALCKNGVPKIHSIHRLVARAFIGPCPDGHEVNHKNFNRIDNHISNLEYMTKAENIRHGNAKPKKHTSLRGPMLPNVVLTEDQVRKIRTLGKTGEKGKDIATQLEIKRYLVYSVLSNKSWKWVK